MILIKNISLFENQFTLMLTTIQSYFNFFGFGEIQITNKK